MRWLRRLLSRFVRATPAEQEATLAPVLRAVTHPSLGVRLDDLVAAWLFRRGEERGWTRDEVAIATHYALAALRRGETDHSPKGAFAVMGDVADMTVSFMRARKD